MSYSNETKIDTVMKFNGHEVDINGDFGYMTLKKTDDRTGASVD
jgi:hypothetical protein